jgi:hypothetical protein
VGFLKQPNIKVLVLRVSQLELNMWLQLSGLDRAQYGGVPNISANLAVAIFMVKDYGREFGSSYLSSVSEVSRNWMNRGAQC